MTSGARQPADGTWQVESLRVTVFLSGQADATDWWGKYVRVQPDEVVSRVKAGFTETKGEIDGRLLTLRAEGTRVDWALSARLSESEDPETILKVMAGAFHEVTPSSLKITEPWISSLAQVTRLAFGAVLIQPVESRKEGYARLAKYLGQRAPDPENSSDFLYQINRQRRSKRSDTTLNVL